MGNKGKKVVMTRPTKSPISTKQSAIIIKDRDHLEGPGVNGIQYITSSVGDNGTLTNDTIISVPEEFGRFFVGTTGENPDHNFVILAGKRVAKNGRTVYYNPGDLDPGFVVLPDITKNKTELLPAWREYFKKIPIIGGIIKDEKGGLIKLIRKNQNPANGALEFKRQLGFK